MTLQTFSSQLSLGLQGDDVARLHQALRALGRDVPIAEAETRTFGAATAATVTALQADLDVPATGIVDATTVEAINAALARRVTAPRTVRGRVADANGRPAQGLSVQVYLQGAAGETMIGSSSLDADGSYAISYEPPPQTRRVDIRVEVRNPTKAVETQPPGSSILTEAGPLEVVDFVVSAADRAASSDFDRLLSDLEPLLGSRDIATLKEDAENHEISVLAVQSGRRPEQVVALGVASRRAKETGALRVVLYGLLREGLPADAAALRATHPDVQRAALKAAVAKGIVSATLDGTDLEAYLSGVAPAPSADVKRLLGRVLSPPEIDRFIAEYAKNDEGTTAFWKRIESDPDLGSRAAQLKLTVQVAALTGNHEPLVAAVLDRSDIKQAADLVRVTNEQWTAFVHSSDIGVPPDTPGADPEEKARRYVQTILARVEAAFPTRFFAERLGDTPIGTFLRSNPSYDLKRTYPTLFFRQNPDAVSTLSADQRRQLQAYQRLYRLTNSAAETVALETKGIGSAQEIARLSREAFVGRHTDVLSAERAGEVYDRAARISAMALTLFGENAAAMNRTGLRVLPRLDTEKQAALAANNPIPDWQTLFGPVDACACRDCTSVHGAAAYLVDALHFLEDRGAAATLFTRRPDIADIELSCQNTDTPVPLVDLVNEILEDAVVPPSPFAPIHLAPGLEADLGETVASPALSAAFNRPLASGTQVETLDAGKRWRIWDESFAYAVVKDSTGLNVVARNRQTRDPAAERRAAPQYHNEAAYEELARSVYPWNLPFDVHAEEANVFLAHLGVSRRDLIEALRPLPEPFDPSAPVVVRLAAEGLGLTNVERRIVVGESLTPAQPPEAFWGDAHVADLATVRALLDRSGLSSADLEALLSTRFVNPAGAATIAADPDAVDSCDTTKLRIDGLTADIASRLHRFVRLWRKLPLSIADVDRALCGLAPDPVAPVLTNETLVRLDHLRALGSQLRLSVAQVLALWKPIDTREPGSLYRTLFYNAAVFKPQDEDFRLRPAGDDLVHSDKLLANHAAALQAAFQLDAGGFALLVARTDGKLTLANLSVIYRYAVLARQLRLTIPNLLIAIELTGIDPFRADRSEETLRLVTTISATRGSAFDFPRLDYLLRHRASRAASFVPTDESLAQGLADIRKDLLQAKGTTDAETENAQRSATIDRVSAVLGLPADLTADLLERVNHDASTALQILTALSSAEADTLSRINAQPQFETLEKLLKIASTIRALDLPASQLPWLLREHPWLAKAPDPQPDTTPLTNWFSLIQLDRLRQELALKPGALEAVLAALSGVATASGAARVPAKQTFVDVLSVWLGWTPDDIQALVGNANDLVDLGLLGARLPEDYRTGLLVRLNGAMPLLRRLGATAVQASSWCETDVGRAAASAIQNVAKAKYSDDAWQEISVPLQDALRERQRDALVGYLVARPAKWTTSLVRADANDLYAHFLIDVQMGACQLTSRIKQGISSTQLFAQRCLMGLEPAVQIADPKWEEWTTWMKSFRIWEANRKIWLYPENWLEPDLRDDKSPFFRDLENELLQSDLDNAAAEQALKRYLEKLEQVAHLEVAATYQDDDETVHVFGRTEHVPRSYFYRRKEGTRGIWTAWEKLELDIEGDHLIPVVWNRTLMLLWPIFKEKQDETPVKMPAAGGTVDAGRRYWELQLAWSELQYGRWSGKKLSDSVRLQASIGEADILFGNAVLPPGFMARDTAPGVGTDGGGYGSGGTVNPGGGSGPAPTPGVSRPVPPSLVTFKAFPSEDVLTVRAYLRLDYAAPDAISGAEAVYPFGEFRFSGCRKIVSTAYRSQLLDPNFALAPRGTKFDAMWFDETGSGLTMLDGTFSSRPVGGHPGVFDRGNQPAPLPQDTSGLNAQRIDIPLLGSAASPFRVLPPHQDRQFIGDRPFFYMDTHRSFVVTSTGHSGVVVNPLDWVVAEVATLGMASGPVHDGPNETPPVPPRGLTVLAPGANGMRLARELPPVDLSPVPTVRRAISRFWSDRAYTFRNFHHPYACELVQRLDESGIGEVLSLDSQRLADAHSFDSYTPTSRVAQPYPLDQVEFEAGGAFELYNWELFFHVPLLIATRLSANQRFAEAQRWFHYIFDPTGESGGDVPQRYWRTKPFYDRLAADYEQDSVDAIEKLAAQGAPEALKTAVEDWRTNPFNPYAVARLRTTAFQKTVVMKYIDNLIAWGDRLFRADTMEAINEATQLYVLAAEILGRRPETIQRTAHAPVQTYRSLQHVGLLGNSLEQIELLIPDAGDGGSGGNGADTLTAPKVLYFCVQENDKLLGYWDIVADRLFKIRHCMNIEGQVRQLPLFEPPIDPALLVRAQAAGLSLTEVLSDLPVQTPNYRFAVMLQKAHEMTSEVRNLGAALLSTLEKRDAEALSTLRSGQELELLTEMRDVRVRQIGEARANVASLERSRDMAQARKDYYESRQFRNAEELASVELLRFSSYSMEGSASLRGLASILENLGIIKLGAPTTAGTEGGLHYAAAGIGFAATALDVTADIFSVNSQLSGRKGEHIRRKDDWDHQANLATIELKQIDQQLIAAQIRLAMGEQELRNHERQIDDARAVDEFLRDKYTNVDLYQWMIGQVSALYFQGYQLSYELAKRAERCMQHELGLPYGETSFVRFGYWDSLKKGLLAGDLLAHDLKRLDAAYLERHVRKYELTKHVSLVSLAPEQLIALKETGTCEFTVPEWLFDLDTPGHYIRLLQMVSLTIPCIIGPYTTIHCKLQLVKSSYRRNPKLVPGYARVEGGPDDRFIDDRSVRGVESIVTSTAQNDTGLFEPSMRDERYLPFEGSGAISTWRLALPNEFKTFDYNTITDVILHLRYTAQEDESLRDPATASLKNLIADASARPLLRLFSLRHEFPTEWHRFVNSPASATTSMTADLATARFPYFTQGRPIAIRQAKAIGRSKSGSPPQVDIGPGQTPPSSGAGEWTGQQDPGPWTIATGADPKSIDDVFVVLAYTV